MRQVNKPDTHIPPSLISLVALDQLEEIARDSNKDLISEKFYRDSYKTEDGNLSRVVDAMNRYYLYKCAYCERITKADVEHYRPKNKVDDEKHHNGYYWLCYEWTNLIPSCITCNREGGKHSKFPIIGNRVFSPTFMISNKKLDKTALKVNQSPLINEIPYLLHPEIDDPNNFFEFEIDPDGIGIRLTGIDPQKRGNSTVNICKLNREELRIDRQRIVEEFTTSVHSLFGKYIRGLKNNSQFKDGLIDLVENLDELANNPTFSYTYLRKYIIRSFSNFEKVVGPFLKSKCRSVVFEAFKAVFPHR